MPPTAVISAPRSVHFVGICGTAMAAAAAAMKDQGFTVTGSDQNVYPPMSTFLAARQIPVFDHYSPDHLRPQPDLVVIGNAVSRGNPEVEAVLNAKARYCSLPELLKECFIRGKRCIVVSGTHGKTTTTALLTWILEHNGLNPGYLIGGVPENLGQGARFTDSHWFVIEGDEYDTAFFDKRSKFVHYLPEIVIINNLEFDHADIFDNLTAIQLAFQRLIQLVPQNGLLLANGDDPRLAPLLHPAPCPVRRFGLGRGNPIQATDCELKADHSLFHASGATYRINLVGEFNVRNALAAAACALHCGLTPAQIQSAFATFAGVKRRLEIRGQTRGITVIDDFGHHPTAIQGTLQALRIKFANQRLWAVFEPRSNTTRRNVFQAELADALACADVIVVAEVARADQLPPGQRLDPKRLMEDLRARGKTAAYLPSVDSILDHLDRDLQPGDVVCIFSNGGFGGIHQRLLDRLASAVSRK